MSDDRIVRDAEATRVSGLAKTQRHELSNRGEFPQKVKISTRALGYRHSELMQWLDSRPRVGETDAQK